MNINCLIHGHEYEKIREEKRFPCTYAGSLGGLEEYKYNIYSVYRCKKCLKEKEVYDGSENID